MIQRSVAEIYREALYALYEHERAGHIDHNTFLERQGVLLQTHAVTLKEKVEIEDDLAQKFQLLERTDQYAVYRRLRRSILQQHADGTLGHNDTLVQLWELNRDRKDLIRALAPQLDLLWQEEARDFPNRPRFSSRLGGTDGE